MQPDEHKQRVLAKLGTARNELEDALIFPFRQGTIPSSFPRRVAKNCQLCSTILTESCVR